MSEPHCRKMNPRTQKGVHLYDNYCHLLCRCRRHSIRSDFLQKLFLTHSVAVVFTTPGIFFVNASQTDITRTPAFQGRLCREGVVVMSKQTRGPRHIVPWPSGFCMLIPYWNSVPNHSES